MDCGAWKAIVHGVAKRHNWATKHTHIHTPQHHSVFPAGNAQAIPAHPSSLQRATAGTSHLAVWWWELGTSSWGWGTSHSLPPHPTHTQPGLFTVPPWVCCVCQTPVSFHFKVPTLSPMQKRRGSWKGPPGYVSQRERSSHWLRDGTPWGGAWNPCIRTVSPGDQVRARRAREGDTGITRRVDPKATQVGSPWPHTASYTSFGARNPCSKPRGVCCKEIGPGVCYKGLDLEGPLSWWEYASLWGWSRRWGLEEGARARPRPRRHLLGRSDAGDPSHARPLPCSLFSCSPQTKALLDPTLDRLLWAFFQGSFIPGTWPQPSQAQLLQESR